MIERVGFTTAEMVFWALSIMNVFQLVFWGLMVQRLVDKLMSRNYHEYQVAKAFEPQKEKVMPMDMGIPEDMRTINEVNPY